MQRLDPTRTTWHITWGTYGARLPGGARPTVERPQNKPGDPFIQPDYYREHAAEQSMRGLVVTLTHEQQCSVQEVMPELCERGGWTLRACAAAPDHVHVVLDVDRAVHGEKVRRLLKRWIGQMLTAKWGCPAGGTWWAKEGSNKAVKDEAYLNNAYGYVWGQRAT